MCKDCARQITQEFTKIMCLRLGYFIVYNKPQIICCQGMLGYILNITLMGLSRINNSLALNHWVSRRCGFEPHSDHLWEIWSKHEESWYMPSLCSIFPNHEYKRIWNWLDSHEPCCGNFSVRSFPGFPIFYIAKLWKCRIHSVPYKIILRCSKM